MLSFLLFSWVVGPVGHAGSSPRNDSLSVQGVVETLEDNDGVISFQLVKQDPQFAIDLPPSSDRAAALAALQAADKTSRSVVVHYDVEGGRFTDDRSRVVFPVRGLEYDGETLAIGDSGKNLHTPASDEAFVRGLGLFYGGKYSEALAELDTALSGGDDADWKGLAHKLRALAHSERVYSENEAPTDAGDRELVQALQDAREWQSLNSDEAAPLYKIGDTLRELGAYPEALGVFKAVSRGWSDEAFWAAIRMGATEREQHHYPEALAALDKLVSERGPQAGMAYHYHRGWTLTELGRYAEAVGEFSEGLKDQPDYAWAFVKRSCAEAHLGQTGAALADQQAGRKLLQRFVDDSRGSQHDIQRAAQVESELRLAVDRKQPIDAKASCRGYWREEEGRSRSALLPKDLSWVRAVGRAPSISWRTQPFIRVLFFYAMCAVIVALIAAIGAYLKRRRATRESKAARL